MARARGPLQLHCVDLVLAALAALIVPASAAAKKPKPAAWAAKHHLKGPWRAKDADRDGLKNGKEFELGTNPCRADSDFADDEMICSDDFDTGAVQRSAEFERDDGERFLVAFEVA